MLGLGAGQVYVQIMAQAGLASLATIFVLLRLHRNGTGGWNIFVGNYMGDICMLTNNSSTWTTIDPCAFYAGVHTLVVCPNGAGGSNMYARELGQRCFAFH